MVETRTHTDTLDFHQSTFEHIQNIAKGRCTISEEMILANPCIKEQRILQGLLLLFEDMELYKAELKEAMETEYKVKVLEQKNKQLEQFNYIASHDLQEPLRTISSFSNLLHKRYINKLDDNANTYLNFIMQSTERMSLLINGLLNYSRLGQGSVLQEIDVNEMIDSIRLDLQASVEEVEAEIIVSGAFPILSGYKMELRQLFLNLISNALKFIQPNQKPCIEISCELKERGYVFCVKDNGIGIEEEYKSKIFGIFQRLHDRVAYEGTGIGLAHCQKIVDMHNGQIWCESIYGEGSSFYFIIPYLKTTKLEAEKI